MTSFIARQYFLAVENVLFGCLDRKTQWRTYTLEVKRYLFAQPQPLVVSCVHIQFPFTITIFLSESSRNSVSPGRLVREQKSIKRMEPSVLYMKLTYGSKSNCKRGTILHYFGQFNLENILDHGQRWYMVSGEPRQRPTIRDIWMKTALPEP